MTMLWWTHRPNSQAGLVLGLLFVVLVICSALEDSVQKECGKSQHKCLCGIPRCIDKALVKDGVQDCVDGSDEGQWDPSKCAIKNTTSENIRFKRAALSELKKVVNNGATTTFYEDGRGQLQTRPVGLLTTTMGAFITSGTTTEYITKLLATYIKNTYARIQTTSSRIYHAVPTELPNGDNMMIRPTGFIASTVSTEVHGYATTAITTDFYRTYIDGTYAQVVSSYSNVHYPPWYTDAIDGTKPPSVQLATASDADTGLIYATPVLSEESFRTTLQVVNNGKLETVIIAPIVPSKSVTQLEPTAQGFLPQELSGNFITKKSSNGGADIVAELGLVEDEKENRLRALRLNNVKDNEVRVTGTHGNFVHTNPVAGDETTYNVFTGTYVQNSKTFLFFFGNTVLSPSATVAGTEQPQQTIIVENGPQKNSVIVDMSKNLKVIVPATNNRATVDSSINGEVMEGVMIEIESSESDMPYSSDFISVDGATKQTPIIGPQIDAITLTLEKNPTAASAAALTASPNSKKSKSFSPSSSSSKRKGSSAAAVNVENEIPTARKVPASSGLPKPSKVQPPALTLPTFTVGQYDPSQEDDMASAPTVADVKLVPKSGESVSSSSSSSSSRKSVPVFQRPASATTPSSNNNNNKVNSYYTVPGTGPRTQKGQPGSFRNPKSGTGRNAGSSIEAVNEVDSLDLQSAASTGRATVTYVGFADFTTTVGNTVIVFMPRTRMIEDLSVHAASKTISATSTSIRPTAQYTSDKVPTTTRVTSTTTERSDTEDTVGTTIQPPKEKSKESSSRRAPKKDFTPKYLGSSTFGSGASASDEIKPASVGSETTIVYSGRQTIFTNLDHHNSKILQQQSGVQTRLIGDIRPSATPNLPVEPTPIPPSPGSSSNPSPSDKRSSLFSPRPKYTPKLLLSKTVSDTSSSGVVSPTAAASTAPLLTSPVVSKNGHLTTATTAIYQTDKVNPTGLVTSIGGSIVRDSTTTLFTSLIFGTYIDTSYAQIIKSTSTVFFLIPSASPSAAGSIFTPPSPTYSKIKPTPVAKFSSGASSTSKPAVFSYEVTTTSESSDEESSTTPANYDRAEVSVTTTESIVSANVESSNVDSTTPQIEDSESRTTTPKSEVDNESQNEIEGRKVGGNRPAKGQIISDVSDKDKVSASPAADSDDEEQTIFVTRTLPTTVYRTYTYYTTFFIPTENEETVTSVISREITSTAVGFVKKTFSNIVPTSTIAAKPAEASATATDVEDDEEEDELKSIGEELLSPTSTQLIYKTFFTTYTYVTTFFTGQTTSLASREEVVSNVVTLTTLLSDQPSSAAIVPTSSAQPSSSVEPTKSKSYGSPSRSLQPGKFTASKKFRPSSSYSTLPRSPLFADGSSSSAASSSVVVVEPEQSSTLIPSSVVEQTILKTFYTSLTYFTTLFNGVDASTKTRTEVITNIVPTVTRSTVYNTVAPSPVSEQVEPTATASPAGGDEPPKHNVGETTFYTTYTYLSSIFKDGTTYHKSSLDTYTNVVAAGSTIRSGLVKKPASAVAPAVEPTKVVGRTAATASKKPLATSDDDLNEVGSHLSETSQATAEETATTAFELEGSEGTTDKSVYNEHEQFYEDDKSSGSDEEVDENEIVQATPALKTYFTTFTFFTTFYKHGTSTVSSRLETVTNVASDPVQDPEASATDQQVLPVYPITYFTTYTYWTTSFRDKTPVVTSREETVSNIVTPGIDDVAPTKTSTYEALRASETAAAAAPAHTTREGKQNNDLAADVEPSEIFAEVELTTYFTTYTYYTTSYIGDETMVNSRFETVTNLVTGTIEPTQVADLVAASETAAQTPRAIGSAPIEQQLVDSTTPTLEDHDYDLPVGLLSTVVNSEVDGLTTTVFSTDVFGTFIDGIYAQVLESTSKIIIAPTAASQSISVGMETNYLPDAVLKSTGLIASDEGKVLEGENNNTITFYTTKTYGTVIDNTYAQVVQSTATIQVYSEDTDQNQFKTGILRVTDGSAIEDDKTTTFYTTSVLGTVIGNQYAQILESTSRVVINPSRTEEFTTVQPTGTVDIESSEDTTEDVPTTTEESKEEEEGKVSSKRFLGRGRERASRPAFTPPGSKSFTPFITPFSSRSRAAFAPKRKQTSAVIVTRTDVTPTVTATLAPASTTKSLPTRGSGSSFASRQRYRRPEESSSGTTPSSASGPTPRLPSTLSRTRFQRPRPGSGGAESASEVLIQPTSASQATGSSPGGRGRGGASGSAKISSSSGFSRRGSSTFPGRSSATSTSAFRGTGASSSRYNVRGRGSISPTKSATTVKPTAALEDDEYEIIEYEYDNSAPAVGPSTTEKATTPNRFGNNRFRLNPRLQTSNLIGVSTSSTTTPRTGSGNVAFPKRRTFTKPTQATTSTTSGDSNPNAAVIDGVTEVLEAGAPVEASTTLKPRFALKNLIKPVGRTSPGSGGSNRVATTTTTTTPAPKTTTRRAFAPRSRPSGFPNKGLIRPTAGTTTTAVDVDNSDDELELEETKNLPPTASLEAASSNQVPLIADAMSVGGDLQQDESIQVVQRLPLLESEQQQQRYVGEKTFEGDVVNVPYLVDSGTQFFEDVHSPYESYEYYLDDNSNTSNSTETESSEVGRTRGQTLKRSVRQVADYAYDDNDYYFGQRKRSTLRSKFRPSTYNTRNTNSRSVSSLNSDYDDYYYDETPAAPPPPPTTTTTTTPAPRGRFRGRISPTTSTSRQTPFTLTNPNTRTSSFTNTRSSGTSSNPTYARRSQSRYRPSSSDSYTATTTSRPSSSSNRFRSRYRGETTTTPRPLTRSRYSSGRGRGSSSYSSSSLGGGNIRSSYLNSDDRYSSSDDTRTKDQPELGTISVTHYIPAETTIPVINGKETEYKTILTPSPSVEILAPYQYTYSDYQGKSVLLLNSELSSTPSFGVTEVTKYLIRESSTTSITFTPTTIRGRKTSFSHIVPSTVYSIEPIVSTITSNPLADNTQLTNLLLNQLLGNLNLNQNGLLNNFQQQQQQQQPFQMLAPGESATPITQYNTKTTSYVTTVTDYTSTVLPITLHGKAIKTTIVESSTNVITATEFITESTVITPTQTQPAFVPQTRQQQQQQPQLNGLNPALLQGLFQQQQALVLQQQQQALIQPTAPALLVHTHTQTVTQTVDEEMAEARAVKQQHEEKPQFSVVTLYVSGRNPGEFSTVLSTVPFETNRVKRSVPSSPANSKLPFGGNDNELYSGEFTKVEPRSKVVPTATPIDGGEEKPTKFDYDYEDDTDSGGEYGDEGLQLEDSYSFSDVLGSTLVNSHSNINTNTVGLSNEQILQVTRRRSELDDY